VVYGGWAEVSEKERILLLLSLLLCVYRGGHGGDGVNVKRGSGLLECRVSVWRGSKIRPSFVYV